MDNTTHLGKTVLLAFRDLDQDGKIVSILGKVIHEEEFLITIKNPKALNPITVGKSLIVKIKMREKLKEEINEGVSDE